MQKNQRSFVKLLTFSAVLFFSQKWSHSEKMMKEGRLTENCNDTEN